MLKLLPHHEQLIRASAISSEVADARGYRSVTEKRELNGIFGPVQQRVPGLLIPLYDVYGEVRSYQLRPDEPRIGKNGKAIKYETPRGLKMMLDCPPATLEHIRNPKVRLWITEGIRKADALVSVGLPAIALLGVDCWRGTNEINGKTTLEDWFGVALNDRRIVICFDSDAFEKPEIHRNTQTLGRWLESRGAKLSFVYLPHAEDGSKQGVDDYLARHFRDELLARIERVWHPLPHQTTRPKEPSVDAPLTPTAEVITEVASLMGRFLVMPSRAASLATALWVLHSWAFDAAHATPYLVARSAVKRSGKSRYQEVLEVVVRSPWRIAAASESALFRKIESDHPTLLLDEVDALFGGSAESNEPIRAILNAGYRPGLPVARVVGEGHAMTVADFDTFCPKCLAGIVTPRWPDTVIDRSITIDFKRKLPGEKVERFRPRKVRAETEDLRARLGRWAAEHVDTLRTAEPALPAKLDDRAAEVWEPLLAIAELADREQPQGWANRAGAAAVKLAGGRDLDDEARGVVALGAIRDVFGEGEALHTSMIVEKLNDNEQLPFAGYRKGAGIDANGLARLLKPFSIRPHPIQIGGAQARGYNREQFRDPWARYCDEPGVSDVDGSKRATPGVAR